MTNRIRRDVILSPVFNRSQSMPNVAVDMLWIVLGSAFGGVARYGVSSLVAQAAGETFPWSTLVVNVSGATAIGAVAAMADAGRLVGWTPAWPLLVVGFLASYTTVSAVSFQTLVMVRQGAGLRAAANLALSLALCLSAVAAAYLIAGTMLAGGTR